MAADEPPDTGEPVSEDRIARARMRRSKAADEGDIAPKLPRGGGFKIGKGHFIKIALTASLLVMLIVIQRPCANAVSSFVTGFDEQGSDKAKMPKPGNVDSSPRYEPLNSTLTEAEWKAMVARQKGEPPAASGSGSAGTPAGSATGSAGSGTPAGSATGSAGSGIPAAPATGSAGSGTPAATGSAGSGSAGPAAR